jgi:hypothetical protein
MMGTEKSVSSMSRSKLRHIKRLRTYAALLIAERNRREKEREDSRPSLAEDHLLRVILVFSDMESLELTSHSYFPTAAHFRN